MLTDTKALLKILTNLDGIASNEKEVSDFILSKLDVTPKKDGLGSLIYTKGNGPKVLISAHIDEIGLMITQITKDGFLKFQTVGNFFPQQMLSQVFVLTTQKGKIQTVMSYKPIHTLSLEAKSKSVEIKDMFLDAGFKSDQEAILAGVRIGDMVTPQNQFNSFQNNKVAAKGLDNRVGVAAVMELFNQVEELNTELNVAFTVQKEFGQKGARTTAFMVEPDIVISVDAADASDLIGGEKPLNQLGNGPLIYIYDNGLIAHPKLRNFVIEVAKKYHINYQESFMMHDQSEAAVQQLSKYGAAGLSIGIPVRNKSSHQGIVDIEDIHQTVLLLKAVLKELNNEVISNILNN